MPQEPTVVILVGPKGAGKSTIGRQLSRASGVVFVDVEAIFRQLADPADVAAGYRQVAQEVEARLRQGAIATLEITGAAPQSEALIERLRERSHVLLVRLLAPVDLCWSRVTSRDASRHLPASEELVRRVHAVSEALSWKFDLTIDTAQNDVTRSVSSIRELLTLPTEHGDGEG